MSQFSIYQKCIDEIQASFGVVSDYKQMHTALRVVNKVAEAKFLDDMEDSNKEVVDYGKPPIDLEGDLHGLKQSVDTISPCSGFLYQGDILLQEDQSTLIVENAITYAGEALKRRKVCDVFAQDELKLLERSPAFFGSNLAEICTLLRPPPPPAPAPAPAPLPPPLPPPLPLQPIVPPVPIAQPVEQRCIPCTMLQVQVQCMLCPQPQCVPCPQYQCAPCPAAQCIPCSEYKCITCPQSYVPVPFGSDTAPNTFLGQLQIQVEVSLVEAAVNRWRDTTCLTFERITVGVRNIRGNYLNFIRGEGCHSMVGKNKKGEGQSVSIGAGCEKVGVISHEIGHALGLWHEQARPDRDAAVSILAKNIPKKYLGQFLVQDFETRGVPYDYGSIMHYAAKAYVKSPTLFSIEANLYRNTMGQRKELSFLDAKVINQAYCRDFCKSDKQCANGGFVNPKNCDKCRCPSGLGGNCDEPAKTGSSCGETTLTAGPEWTTLDQSGRKECNYLIKAAVPITIEVTEIKFACIKICRSYVEVKFTELMEPTGARLCCGKETFTTRGPQALILYRGSKEGHKMSLRYKA